MGVLDGKVALVTGASHGIGAEIARRFGAEGAAVAVAARSTAGAPTAMPGTIDETVAEISGAGGTAVAISADLSRPDDRDRLAEETTARLGAPDILVSNAAVTALERFSTGLAAELYEDNIAVNALAPTRVVPTPGTIFHHLTTPGDPRAEPPAVMAEAALLLCHREPRTLTGRIAYSQELLAEFGVPVPRLQADAGGQRFPVIAGVAEEQLAGLGPLEVQVRVVLSSLS